MSTKDDFFDTFNFDAIFDDAPVEPEPSKPEEKTVEPETKETADQIDFAEVTDSNTDEKETEEAKKALAKAMAEQEPENTETQEEPAKEESKEEAKPEVVNIVEAVQEEKPAEETNTEDKPEVTVTKKRRGRRKKKDIEAENAAKEEIKSEDNTEDESEPKPENSAPFVYQASKNSKPNSGNLIEELYISPSPEFEKIREIANKMMNDITITPDMDLPNLRVMQARIFELQKWLVDKIACYNSAYKNLSDKHGLMELVVKKASQNTAKEKRNAALAALEGGYKNRNGETINLIEAEWALRSACNFLNDVNEFVKAASVSVNVALKITDPTK